MREHNSFTGQFYESDRIEKSRTLAAIDVDEISLVNKAANKKKFLFFKSSEEGSCIDLLNTLEAVEDNYSLSEEENVHIEKALKVLNTIESEDVEALSNVILLLSKLIDSDQQDTAVSKASNALWPSFSASSRRVQKNEVTDETIWPSLTGAMSSI